MLLSGQYRMHQRPSHKNAFVRALPDIVAYPKRQGVPARIVDIKGRFGADLTEDMRRKVTDSAFGRHCLNTRTQNSEAG